MKERKPLRLKEYDYSGAGCYFITICTKDRKPLFSSVVGAGHPAGPVPNLSPYGEIVERNIEGISTAYSGVIVDKYTIMPNHIHMLLRLQGPAGCPAPTKVNVRNVIGALKSLTTRAAGFPLWQRSYYDHIIRDEEDYLRIWNYIDTNPARWAEDEYYTDQPSGQ